MALGLSLDGAPAAASTVRSARATASTVRSARAAASSVRWSAPFGVSAPQPRDLTTARLALSPSGTAIGFASYEEDHPSDSQAELATAPPGGRIARPRLLAGAGRVLALSYAGRRLWLLLGSSRRGSACCEDVELEGLSPGRRAVRQTILRGISGATEGRLQILGGRALAVLATAQGVWASQSDARGRFARARRLSAPGAEPDAVTSATTSSAGSAVAWTQQSTPFAPAPSTVWIARGSPSRAPSRRRIALIAPAGRTIDQLALAPGRGAPTLAFAETWFDSFGAFHSEIFLAELRGSARARLLSQPGQLASAVEIAGAPDGAQVLSFRSCTMTGACSVRAALRPAGRPFGPSETLGTSDPGQAPAAAESPNGQAVVVFVNAAGRVLAAASAPGARRMASAQTLSRAGAAATPRVAFMPGASGGLAAWVQGLARESVVAARFSVRAG